MSFFRSILPLKRSLSSNVRRPKPVRPIVLRLEYLEERCTPAVHDLTTAMNFSTIQAAVNAANPGDTILADAGTYAESVTVNKSLIIEGAQHMRWTPAHAPERKSIVDGSGTNNGLRRRSASPCQ